ITYLSDTGCLEIQGASLIGQRNSYVKTWGCGGFLNETNIYSRGKSLCF
ncbi:5-carboxymethyl-2-hydroxymuconate semialdehyde dehydrogenase, partial [Shigella dysenteriae]